MQLRWTQFGGMIPRAADYLLPETGATKAVNVDLAKGDLRPLKGLSHVVDVPLSGNTVGTIYRWRAGATTYWFRFPGHVSVARGPLADDARDRVYWTGDPTHGEPRMSFTPLAHDGGTEYPIVSRKLGIPAPDSTVTVSGAAPQSGDVAAIYHERPIRVETAAPHGLDTGATVNFSITATAPANPDDPNAPTDLAAYLNADEWQITRVDDTTFLLADTDAVAVDYTDFQSGSWEQTWPAGLRVTRFYVHSYVSDIGEEGPPSEPSPAATLGHDQGAELDLPSPSTTATQGRVLEKRRIYRTAGRGQTADFVFVDEVDIATSSVTDTLPGAQTGEALPTVDWLPPPADLQGLITTAGGAMAGHKGQQVLFSELNLPHAWPSAYRLALDHEVVALAPLEQGVAVATTGDPYLLTGLDPRAITPQRLDMPHGCVSARSMAAMPGGAIYAAAEGLVWVGTDGAQLLTASIMTAEDWAAYAPASMHAHRWDGRYVAFYNTGAAQGALILDPRNVEAGIVELDVHARDGHRDASDETLYVLDTSADRVMAFDSGPALSMTWRSSMTLSPPVSMAAARVDAEDYGDVTLDVLADGVVLDSIAVTANEPVRLPPGRARHWQVEVRGTSRVRTIRLGDSMRAMP